MDSDILNLTLLYVEDDADTRKSLSQLFENKVRKLFVAKDGAEALKIFKENNIHLIISDYQMPNMNGNELCSMVKQINPQITFVLLTAYTNTNLLIDAIDTGVDKFLQKPIQAKKLFNILNDIERKILNTFEFEKSNVCLQEAEKIALLSYWDVNLNTQEIEFSLEACELFDFKTQEKNKCYMDFANIVIKEDREKFIDIFINRVFHDEVIDEIIAITNSSGNILYLHIIAKRWESSICGNKHVVGIFQDVTTYEHQKQRLIKENLSDPMLKISNKKNIILELEKLIKLSKRYGHSIGVIFFDIDDFKAINEEHGHLVADDLLFELSQLIQNNIRQSDVFGRWGGDEFILLIGYSSPDSTIELAQKISNRINNFNWKCKVNLTISMGLAFYEQHDDAYKLLNRADKKMLEAKHSGKNRYNY